MADGEPERELRVGDRVREDEAQSDAAGDAQLDVDAERPRCGTVVAVVGGGALRVRFDDQDDGDSEFVFDDDVVLLPRAGDRAATGSVDDSVADAGRVDEAASSDAADAEPRDPVAPSSNPSGARAAAAPESTHSAPALGHGARQAGDSSSTGVAGSASDAPVPAGTKEEGVGSGGDGGDGGTRAHAPADAVHAEPSSGAPPPPPAAHAPVDTPGDHGTAKGADATRPKGKGRAKQAPSAAPQPATAAPVGRRKKKGKRARKAAVTAASRRTAGGAGGGGSDKYAYASVTTRGGEEVRKVRLRPDEAKAMVEGDGTQQYTGTFRWPASHKFMGLPRLPEGLRPVLGVVKGWQQYLGIRFPGPAQIDILSELLGSKEAALAQTADVDNEHVNDDGKLVVEPALLDGLSFPMSLIVAARTVGFRPRPDSKLTILVLGASIKAEQRIAESTPYFTELREYFLPQCQGIHLVLIGPEIEAKKSSRLRVKEVAEGMTYSAFRGTTQEFLDSRKVPPDPQTTLVCGFNTGFGAGNRKLTLSWLPGLAKLAELHLLCIFTCANDYGDVRGETAVLRNLLGIHFLLDPVPSPFRAVSTFHAPGSVEKEWSCANSFFYAVCGFASGERPKVDIHNAAQLQRALSIIFPS